MALLYAIAFYDRFGRHVARKWGETPDEALGFLQATHKKPGRGEAEYDPPVPVDPQPFGHPSRRQDARGISSITKTTTPTKETKNSEAGNGTSGGVLSDANFQLT